MFEVVLLLLRIQAGSPFSSKLWLTFRLRVTERTDSPLATRSFTRVRSMARRGRPRILPLRFAVHNPEMVRSINVCRSCRAIAAITLRTMRSQSISMFYYLATVEAAVREVV